MRRRLCSLLVLLLGLSVPAGAQPADVLGEARAWLVADDPAEAAAVLQAADTLGADGFYLLGRAQAALLRYDRAVEALQRADTAQARVLAALAQSYDRLGRRPEAVRLYERAYAADSLNRPIGTRLAKLYAETGQWASVRTIYDRLVRGDPENPYLLAQLATSYRALDSLEQAVVLYERAHRRDLASVQTALQLSSTYMQFDHLVSARRVLDRSLEVQSESPLLWARRGEVAMREEQYDVAQNAFARTLALGDSSAATFRSLGISRYWMGETDEAAEALAAAFERDTLHVMGTFYLGVARLQQERFDEAVELFDHTRLLMQEPVLASVHARTADARKAQQRYPAAIRHYRLALDLDPDAHDARFGLANTYEVYYADPTTALEAYTTYLERAEGDAHVVQLTLARQRIEALRERLFFDGRLPGGADTSGSLLDTAGRGE